MPNQNQSPNPGGRRTPTPEPQSSPSPRVRTPDLTISSDAARSTAPPPGAELDQDTHSVNGEPEDGGSDQVTPSRG